ncbi:MAG: glycosyltransferase, partial [Desulfatiglandales bacterium]|nr:glycosyltransferase [Desulfatiglandales bacterium]
VNVLKNLQISDLEITIAIGLANCHREMLQKEASSAFPKIKILQHVENMSELMASADLAVSGGGTTCLEMAFMGLPNAVIILAENQRSAVEELSKEDCSINLGEQEKITSKIVTDAMEKLIYGKDLRIRMSEKGPHIIDGIGVERVLDTIMQIDSTQSVQSP